MGKCENGNAKEEWKNLNIPVPETKLNYYDKCYHEYGKENKNEFLSIAETQFSVLHTKEIQCTNDHNTKMWKAPRPISYRRDIQTIQK